MWSTCLRRLGLRSRTQIAVWAVERGLYRSGKRDDDRDCKANIDVGGTAMVSLEAWIETLHGCLERGELSRFGVVELRDGSHLFTLEQAVRIMLADLATSRATNRRLAAHGPPAGTPGRLPVSARPFGELAEPSPEQDALPPSAGGSVWI